MSATSDWLRIANVPSKASSTGWSCLVIVGKGFRDDVLAGLEAALKSGAPDPSTKMFEQLSYVLKDKKSNGLTWRTMLMGALATKAAHGAAVDALSFQTQDPVGGARAYSLRSVQEKVLGPFERNKLGFRITGGTVEPGTNKPMREERLDPGYRTRRPDLRDANYSILSEVEHQGQDFAKQVLREALSIVMSLEDATPAAKELAPFEVDEQAVLGLLLEIISESGGGERVVLVYSAVEQALMRSQRIAVKPNVVTQSGARNIGEVGDVEMIAKDNGMLRVMKCAEVKDKAVTIHELEAACIKATAGKCPWIEFVFGPRCEAPAAHLLAELGNEMRSKFLRVTWVTLDSGWLRSSISRMYGEDLHKCIDSLVRFVSQIRASTGTQTVVFTALKMHGFTLAGSGD